MTTAAQLAANPLTQKRKKGMAHTPSFDEIYAPLEKQGLGRIVRKKGRAPKFVWN